MNKPFQTIVVRNPFMDLEQFKGLAERCVVAGVTHLTFTEVERSYWEIDDPLDPYLNWSVVHTSMLKLFPPDILKEWVPEDYIQRQRKIIAARAAVLKKAGLKGATFLYDPMYWPEAVFRKYPELRGPRVDHPERCVHPRYAPCVDRPEVLAFYRQAFRQLYELSEGGLDVIIIRTNDSATGFCWTNLYNGANGPADCRNISPTRRVSRFLTECLAGPAEVGGQPRIYVGGGAIGGENRAAFLNDLPERCGYYSHAGANHGGERILTGCRSNFSLFPIRGIPNPVEILDKLAGFYERGWRNIVLFTCPAMYGNDWEGDVQTLKIIEYFNKKPGHGFPAMAALSRQAAGEIFGEKNADDVTDAWWNIFLASEIMNKSDVGTHGFFIFLTSLAQRWLTRPLVVFPERLTEAEKTRYKPHLFQANPAHENFDLLDLEPVRLMEGPGHLEFFNRLFDDGVAKYIRARNKLQKAFGQGGEKDKNIKNELSALEILFCFLRNIRNCVNFQIKLEKIKTLVAAGKSKCGGPGASRAPDEYRQARIEINDILRAEMDNTLKLAGLLEQNGLGLIETAATEEGETPFLLGPEIIGDLRRKVEIMTDHFVDTDKLIGYQEDQI